MTQTLRKVPIFQPGDHKFGPWVERDIYDMARNAAETSHLFQPPIAIGHDEDQAATFSEFAFGQAKNFGVEYHTPKGGTKPLPTLVADFEEVPDSLAYLIHQGSLRGISPEIYQTLPNSLNGKVTGPVIKRVALLGSSLPEVKTTEQATEVYRKQVPALAFSEPRAELNLTFNRAVVDETAGTVLAFSDVTTKPRFTKKPLASCTDATKAAVHKFDESMAAAGTDAGNLTTMQAVPLSRDELIAILADAGFDISTLTPATPDAVLMDMARMARMFLEETAATKAGQQAAEQEAAGATDMATETKTPAETPEEKAKREAKAGENQVVKMSDVDAIVERLVKEKVAKFSDEQKAITDGLTAQRKQITDELNKARAAKFSDFVETQRKAGKILPCEIDGGLIPMVLALDAAVGSVVKFGDNDEKSVIDKFMDFLGKRPPLMRFADIIKHKSPTQADAEVADVMKFCDDHADQIKSGGRKANDYVELFKRRLKDKPELTAAEFLGGVAVA